MPVDFIVSSLPPLSFEAPAPISWEAFRERIGGDGALSRLTGRFTDLETQLRNALAEARAGNADFARPTRGCSLYWKNRVLACFQEADILRRETALDRVWWDAAGELTASADPLGEGALATYALRLKIVLKRGCISAEAGNAAFDRLTAETKITL